MKFFGKISMNKKPTLTLRKSSHPALSGNKVDLRHSGSKSDDTDAIKYLKLSFH